MLKDAFFEALAHTQITLGNQFCVGIDPDIAKLTGFLKRENTRNEVQNFLEAFSRAMIDAAAGRVASVKFQSAYFEAGGAEGILALKNSVAYAQTRGLLTILDVKRGDIGPTMTAYGQAAFGYCGADAMTFSPYLGVNVLDALLPWFKRGKGVYVVWISSNQDAVKMQDSIKELILSEVNQWRMRHQLLHHAGLVLGATKVAALGAKLFQECCKLPLLLPGLGAQGAEVGQRFSEVNKRSAASSWPVSRGFSGIDSDHAISQLEAMKSWGEYRDFVSQQISIFLESA